MYLVKSSFLFQWFYPKLVWRIKPKQKELYLTFDDGPNPLATRFVLDTLKKYNAEGTFFCIGNNVEKHPELYNEILEKGHAVGNHTHNHLNGWKTDDETYLKNIEEASEVIYSKLFRPPYGKIKHSQIKKILKQNERVQIIMWNILSGDFDRNISGDMCAENVINNTKSGDIIVFHDSEKAFERLSVALPKTLEYFSKRGYEFKKIDASLLK